MPICFSKLPENHNRYVVLGLTDTTPRGPKKLRQCSIETIHNTLLRRANITVLSVYKTSREALRGRASTALEACGHWNDVVHINKQL